MAARFLTLIIIAFVSTAVISVIPSCGRNSSDDFDRQTDDDDDDNDDDSGKDTDGDGCPDYLDYAPDNPEIGCTKPDDENKPGDIAIECVTEDEGLWVDLIICPEDDNTESCYKNPVLNDFEECLEDRVFDESIKVTVKWCTDHKDGLKIVGDSVAIQSFGEYHGDVGAFAGMYKGGVTGSTSCPKNHEDGKNYQDRAYVTVQYEGGKPLQYTWQHPGLTFFTINAHEIDAAQPTHIVFDSDSVQIDGRSTISYTQVANFIGATATQHLFKIIDVTGGGADVYGINFTYKYNKVKKGAYVKLK